jgi:hypothetical protein
MRDSAFTPDTLCVHGAQSDAGLATQVDFSSQFSP